MDVDAGSVSQNTYKGLSPLSDTERAELAAKRACFCCRQPGHISRNCPSRRGPAKVNAGQTAQNRQEGSPAPNPSQNRRVGSPAPSSYSHRSEVLRDSTTTWRSMVRRPRRRPSLTHARIFKRSELAAVARTFKLRKLYISRFNSLIMPFDFNSTRGRQEERALVDSGATANFIDQKTVKRLRLKTLKLEQTHSVRNIDGTFNQAGLITRACDLLISQGGRQERTRFYVTNLGGDRFIFGYPWLATSPPASTGLRPSSTDHVSGSKR